jgi:hypothetical protein
MSVHLVRGLRRGRRHQHRHRTLWLRVVRTREDVKRVEEVRFRVDEKLARRDDVLSQLEPIQNLRAATVLGADTHDGRAKVVGIIGDDHVLRAPVLITASVGTVSTDSCTRESNTYGRHLSVPQT